MISSTVALYLYNSVHTCGFMSTKSMKITTKSCSTYLSAKRLQRGHCVRRTPFPSARSSALLYVVYSVFTGARHSMQIGIALADASVDRVMVWCAGNVCGGSFKCDGVYPGWWMVRPGHIYIGAQGMSGLLFVASFRICNHIHVVVAVR